MEQKQVAQSAPNQDKIWQHFQNDGQESFAGNAPRLDYLVKRVRKLAPNSRPRVLNIGIGNAYFEKRCVDSGFQTSSLDPDATAIARVKNIGVDGRTGTLGKLPFDDGSFDFVVASEVLEHLTDAELKTAMSEIRRVLAPGGNFLGTVPFEELLKDNESICPHCGELFHRWGHQQTFTSAKMHATLSQQLDVRAMKVRAFVSFKNRNWKGKIKSAFKFMLGALGEQVADPHLYFQARKSG